MNFIKVIKASENKKYVIFENIVSENRKGYWNGDGELVEDINNAYITPDLESAKRAVEEQIKWLKDSGETVEHYFAIRPVVLEDLNAVYQIKFNEVK